MNNVEDFGASLSATPEDNAAAFIAANAAGAFLIDKIYPCAAMVFTSAPQWVGVGRAVSGVVTPGIRFDVSGPWFNAAIRDLQIMPSSSPDLHGLEVRLAVGGLFAGFDFINLIVGAFQKQGLFLNNDVSNVDGFFTGRVRDSTILNGIKGTNVGDDLKITGNVLTGGTSPAIFTTHVQGARQCYWGHNSMSTRGGGVKAIKAEGLTIGNNHIEHPSYLGGFVETSADEGALASIHLKNSKHCHVERNQISGGHGRPGPDGLPVLGAGYAILQEGAVSYNNFHNRNVFNSMRHGLTYAWHGAALRDGGYNISE